LNVNEFFRRADEPAKRSYQHVAKAAAIVAWALAVLISGAGIPDAAYAESENLSQVSNKDAETAKQYASKAWAHYEQSNYAAALDLYRKALSIREEALGKEHPDTAQTYNDIAGVYYS
jgi:tetratricopeptide (TPR) repeat protein